MNKVTLIWVSKPEKPFRILSIPKGVVYLITGGFCLFSVLSFVLFWTSRSYLNERVADRLESARLRQALVERDDLHREQQAEKDQALAQQTEALSEKAEAVKALQGQMGSLMQQLHEIRANEGKIRRFLGLEDKAADAKHPNQGGIAMDMALEYEPRGDASASLSDVFFDPESDNYVRSVENSLRELLDYLERRESEARRLPTLTPVASSEYWLTSSFGWRSNPYTGKGKEFHAGLDLAGPFKTPVTASADGDVIETGEDRYLGRFVRIRHSKRYVTVYGHLQSIEVSEGAAVKRGDVVGAMGNTGRSTGIHLHYSVMRDGKLVDPSDYIWDRAIPTLAHRNAGNDEAF